MTGPTDSVPAAATAPANVPTADTPTIRRDRVQFPDVVIAAFGDDTWPLAAMPRNVTQGARTLRWTGFNTARVDAWKHAFHLMINETFPERITEDRWGARERLSQKSIYKVHGMARTFDEWLDRHPDFQEVSPARWQRDPLAEIVHPGVLQQYYAYVGGRRDVDAGTKTDLVTVLRLVGCWGDRLPPQHRWAWPAWADDPYWRFRGGTTSTGNRTEVVDPETMARLIGMAIAFLYCAHDILSAHQQAADLLAATTDPAAGGADDMPATTRARAVLADWIDRGVPLPRADGEPAGNPRGREWLAVRYFAALHGLPEKAVKRAVKDLKEQGFWANATWAERGAGRPFGAEVTALLGDRLWTDVIDFRDVTPGLGTDVPLLLRMLRVAALIVVAYLTGMRGDEVRALRRGCCTVTGLDGDGPVRYRIRGLAFKGDHRDEIPAADDDGGHPAVWGCPSIVARAIDVAHQITAAAEPESDFLFSGDQPEKPISSELAWTHVNEFVTFANARLAPRLPVPDLAVIPTDKRLSLRRFRRTLAMFIRRESTTPVSGIVALSIQYQHVLIAVSDGYAVQHDSEFVRLLMAESWDDRRETLLELQRRLRDGREGVSGPAADRVLRIVSSLPVPATDALLRRLRDDESRVVFDNRNAVALCVRDVDLQQCKPTVLLQAKKAGKVIEPTLLDCRASCLNRAMTDAHALQRVADAEALEREAEISPHPLAVSLLAEAARLRESSARHFAERRQLLDETDTT